MSDSRPRRFTGALVALLVAGLSNAGRAHAQVVPPGAPMFDHAPGAYADVFWLTMAGAASDATMRFTTDGSEPTASSTPFVTPILIATTATVKAKTFGAGDTVSATTTANYVITIQKRTALSVLQVVPRVYQDNPSGFLAACLNLDQWPTVLAHTTFFGTSLGIGGLSDADLSGCVAGLRAHGVELTAATSIINPFSTGADAFAAAAPVLDRLIALDAPLSAIFINEPLTGAFGTSLTDADVVRETAIWIALVRARYPGVRLIIQEAYPSHSAATIVGFIGKVNAAAAARGVAGLDGFELDHDWYGTRWSVADIFAMRTAMRAANMTFSIILWPSGPASTNDCDFRTRTYNQYRYVYQPGYVAYGEDFAPDMWTIESWDPIPAEILPEDGTGCSFMQGARAIVTLGM